ncbi:MAG: 16S rRNA (uracil(1498)-N(3))-methyltransferase [Puniceicoccales bacterium]|nr:16S rRNA (uracil(1498)-N(3))-methyltransferase [Puniceicoccales bacterium]
MAHFYIYGGDGEIVENVPVPLDKAAAHHLLRVLRVDRLDELTLFDGKGVTAKCRLEVSNRHSAFAIPGVPQMEVAPRRKLHLLQGMAKSAAMEDIVRRATELGVWEIHPLQCERGNGGLGRNDFSRRLCRWRSIAIGACSQSRNPFLPTIHEPTRLENIPIGANSLRIGASLGSESMPWKTFADDRRQEWQSGDAYVAVGPEGDFTASEWHLLRTKGFAELSLDSGVLRSETAAVVLLALAKLAL